MCDRVGCTHFPNLSSMDFSGRGAASRRGFLKGAAALTTITMGMGMGGLAQKLAWPALLRKLDRIEPSFRN